MVLDIYIYILVQSDTKHFCYFQKGPVSLYNPSFPLPLSPATTGLFSVTVVVVHFLEFYINAII